MNNHRMRGLSLVELMVALVLGSVLIGGALFMYSQGRGAFNVNERMSRLQDASRYVVALLEPDIELAGYYGLTGLAESVRFVSGGNPNNVVAMPVALRQQRLLASDPQPAALANLGTAAHACGRNYAVDVNLPIEGTDGAYGSGPEATAACDPVGGAFADTDTLTVRRAATQPSNPDAGRLQIYAPRLRSRSAHFMFVDGNAPGTVNANNSVHNLVVRKYYISQNSVGRPGFPSLRVKTLTEVGGQPAFTDEEVMPGIEDLQVQFGIDTGDYNNDGVIDAGWDLNNDTVPESDGRATRYVDPDFPDVVNGRYQVVAVRFWLRVRADQPEVGFTDQRPYRYANKVYTPAGAERQFRRLLVSRTVTLRNSRTL
jgi:type IV pilus assembly protein PilW